MKIIEDLVAGFRRLQTTYLRRAARADRAPRAPGGQAPQAMVVACSDSRVDPAIVTIAARLICSSFVMSRTWFRPVKKAAGCHGTSVAPEFAVRCLSVRHVIVMGHARCGGIRALLGDLRFEGDAGQFIAPWMSIAEAAIPPSVAGGPRLDPIAEAAIPPSVAGGPRLPDEVEGPETGTSRLGTRLDATGRQARREDLVTQPRHDPDARAAACEQAAVRISLANLSSFPFVREAVDAGRLQLHGWYFDIDRGELLGWEPDAGRFCALVPGRERPA